MSEPLHEPRYEGEAPPIVPEHRNPLGWIALALLFLLMFSSSLYGSLKAKGPKKAGSNYEIFLSQETSMRATADKLGEMGATKDQVENLRTQAQESLAEPIAMLVESSLKDPEAARWYAVLRGEQGKPVPPENLAPLRKSSDPKDQALVKIYGSPKLTRTEADKVVRSLPDEPLLYKVARIHALEKAGDTSARQGSFDWRLLLFRGIALLIGVVILAGSGITWAVYLRGRVEGRHVPKGLPLGPITKGDADRLAIRAAQILGLFLLLSFLGRYMPSTASAMLFQGVGILAALPLLAAVPIDGKRLTLQSVGLTRENLGRNILWGIGGFLAEFPLSMLMALLGMLFFSFLPAPSHPASEQLANSKNLLQVLPILLFGSITAPIWEEFVFRGLLFPGLARLTGKIPLAAIATGFIFAMIHPQGISLWFALATVGSIGCALTYQTRSLIPSIVMHVLHNTTIFVIGLLVMGKF